MPRRSSSVFALEQVHAQAQAMLDELDELKKAKDAAAFEERLAQETHWSAQALRSTDGRSASE